MLKNYYMNIISLIGLFPFVLLSFYHNSHGMLIIAVNGFLFHSFPNNKFLYFIDFTTNAILYIKSILKFVFVFKYALFSLFVFLLNNYYFKNHKILCEIIHVIFVQWISLYAIINVYYQDKCFPPLFLC